MAPPIPQPLRHSFRAAISCGWVSASRLSPLRVIALFGVFMALIGIQAQPVQAAWSCTPKLTRIRLCNPLTDNYKDCFNVADGLPELRTWLSMRRLYIGGAYYRPRFGQPAFAGKIQASRVAGSIAMPKYIWVYPTASDWGNISLLTMRNDSRTDRIGVLLTLRSRTALRDEPVRVVLRAQSVATGLNVGAASVVYAWSSIISALSAPSPEYNGPGGRWRISGVPTKTDLEAGATSTCS